MKPWTYRDYCHSIEDDVKYGLTALKFNISQSIGFTRGELEVRLDEYPEENILAITALMVCAGKNNHISEYKAGDGYYEEIIAGYKSGEINIAANHLDEDERLEFLRDVDYVKKELGI